MDTDRIEGAMKDAGGKIKEEWGDLTDDPRTEAEVGRIAREVEHFVSHRDSVAPGVSRCRARRG